MVVLIYNPSTQGAEEGAHDLESSLDYIMNTRLASAIETLPQKTKKYSVQKRRKGGRRLGTTVSLRVKAWLRNW